MSLVFLTIRRMLSTVIGAAALGCFGCASQDPLPVWKERLGRYVVREGRGDPSVLRELSAIGSADSPRSALAVFSAPCASPPTLVDDAKNVDGVLLGVYMVDGSQWYVFAVGVSDQPDGLPAVLEEVRLMAFSLRGDTFAWREEVASPQRLIGYKRGAPRTWGRPFPGPTDDFIAVQRGAHLDVTEMRSGTRFTLDLGG